MAWQRSSLQEVEGIWRAKLFPSCYPSLMHPTVILLSTQHSHTVSISLFLQAVSHKSVSDLSAAVSEYQSSSKYEGNKDKLNCSSSTQLLLMLSQMWMSVNGMNMTASPVRSASMQRDHSHASAQMDTEKWGQSASVKKYSLNFKEA